MESSGSSLIFTQPCSLYKSDGHSVDPVHILDNAELMCFRQDVLEFIFVKGEKSIRLMVLEHSSAFFAPPSCLVLYDQASESLYGLSFSTESIGMVLDMLRPHLNIAQMHQEGEAIRTDGPPTNPSCGEAKTLPPQEAKDPVPVPPEESSSDADCFGARIASTMVGGARSVSDSLVQGSKRATEGVTQRDLYIPKPVLAAARATKTVTSAVAQAGMFLLGGLATIVQSVGSFAANQVSSSKAGQALHVGEALQAGKQFFTNAGYIMNGTFEAGRTIIQGAGESATTLVERTCGHDAGEAVSNTLGAAGHVAETCLVATQFSPTGVASLCTAPESPAQLPRRRSIRCTARSPRRRRTRRLRKRGKPRKITRRKNAKTRKPNNQLCRKNFMLVQFTNINSTVAGMRSGMR
eukprot:gnl/Trimastix_PCT/3009.p1 GENE.gnl/Trimastix_PCT/3009~~gnl/Trimastix_PCT/3009.p1  ORF type:complete len:408 (-),score=41.41 gnl/Trimastix_PCT/3009:166-1389(-)